MLVLQLATVLTGKEYVKKLIALVHEGPDIGAYSVMFFHSGIITLISSTDFLFISFQNK